MSRSESLWQILFAVSSLLGWVCSGFILYNAIPILIDGVISHPIDGAAIPVATNTLYATIALFVCCIVNDFSDYMLSKKSDCSEVSN